jgi:hypothetical protein
VVHVPEEMIVSGRDGDLVTHATNAHRLDVTIKTVGAEADTERPMPHAKPTVLPGGPARFTDRADRYAHDSSLVAPPLRCAFASGQIPEPQNPGIVPGKRKFARGIDRNAAYRTSIVHGPDAVACIEIKNQQRTTLVGDHGTMVVRQDHSIGYSSFHLPAPKALGPREIPTDKGSILTA